ncbi:hypothetical protein ACWEKT_33825 [Nocardia takedensis]
MSWSEIAKKTKKVVQGAGTAIGIASNLASTPDLPKPLQDQYSQYNKEIRGAATRRDVRDRLEQGGRLKNQPSTARDIKQS